MSRRLDTGDPWGDGGMYPEPLGSHRGADTQLRPYANQGFGEVPGREALGGAAAHVGAHADDRPPPSDSSRFDRLQRGERPADPELARTIRRLVAEDLAGSDAALLTGEDRREFARQRIFAHLDYLVDDRGSGWDALGSVAEEERLAQSILDALFGMGRLQSLIDDGSIENIDINGCDRVWTTFADGSKQLVDPVADSDEELVELVRSAASRFGLSERRFDLARPELDLRLPDGSRLSAVMAVSERPSVSIRRHRFSDLSLNDLIELGTLGEELASLLRAAVRSRKNIVVSGAMNSGKTTLLRALASEIPPRERIVTIEQAFELGLDSAPDRHPDLVALEARPTNVEGEGLITVADLVRRGLRMNADRVIVGEVLGDEVLPMLNAMSQGRSGSMCTIHSDSSSGVFRRIASYAIQAPGAPSAGSDEHAHRRGRPLRRPPGL